MPNILDKIIEMVNPEEGLRRATFRRAAQVVRNSGYGNGGANLMKTSMRGWAFHGGDAKADIADNLDVLRERSRDNYMNVPLANGALKTLSTNTLASGLTPTPQIDGAFLHMNADEVAELQAQIMREFSLWADSKLCDADRCGSFYQLQQLAFLGWTMNGDAFATMPMLKRRGSVYDLCVRVLEADRVCSPNLNDVLLPCTVQGHEVQRIVQGVETDKDGAVVAYWVCNRHPLAADANAGGIAWTRAEAYGALTGEPQILHIMQQERAGQVRGVPLLAPVLEALKQLGRYTEAELDAAVITAAYTVFIEKENEGEPPPFGEIVPEGLQLDPNDKSTIELAPGAIVDLAPGEKATSPTPTRPNAKFEAFYDAIVKQIGTALEIPPEVLHKSFNSNYSAARGALNEFWRTCDKWRTAFAAQFCQPIYEKWLALAVASGRVNAPGFFADPAIRKAYCGCTWNGPARTNLNPVDEVNAAILRVQNGYSTAEQETAQMTGGSYAANIRQRTIEAKMKKEVDDIAAESTTQQNGSPVLDNQEQS